MAAGAYHTVAIKNDGTLWAWGLNEYGQLGNCTTTNNTYPVQVMSDVKSVSAGYEHTVALKEDGTLWAWGRNNFGQLGLGDGGAGKERTSPKQIGVATNWVSVFAGYAHTLAIDNDGKFWAWGQNYYGQLGKGYAFDDPSDSNAHYSPVQVGTATDWITVSVGNYHTVVLKKNGTLWAWGMNSSGQLGKGNNYIVDNHIENYNPVQVGTDTDWITVFAVGSHTVAIKSNGTLWAWGSNNYGQLGKGNADPDGGGSSYPDNYSPKQIGVATDWASVSGGLYHTIAHKKNGTLWAWGRNNYGQLGKGNANDGSSYPENYSPERLGEAADLVGVSGGLYHSTALRRSGILWTWGYNNYGQLGNDTIPTTGLYNYSPKPIAVKWK